jgi:hypothetical protein
VYSEQTPGDGQNKFVKLMQLLDFITKKFVTMQGHMNLKNTFNFFTGTTYFGIHEIEFMGVGMGLGGLFMVVPKKISLKLC